MSTSPITASQRLLTLEKQAEWWALTVLRGATFTDCLKISGIAPTLEVAAPKGKTVTIRGSDIYHHGTWKKFLASIKQEEGIYQLTDIMEDLARSYKKWLQSEHTQRYRAISTEADLMWFEQVITLAVARHIMEQKYAAYTTQGLETFADPRIAIEMGNLLMLNHIARDAARIVHHIVKDPAQAQQLIEQFYEEHSRQMQARSLLLSESLSADAIPSFALSLQQEEESHE